MVDKLEARAILAKAYRDNGDIGAANYIEAGHDLLPDTQVHLLAIRDALEARTPANGEQVERIAEVLMLYELDYNGNWPIEKVRGALGYRDSEHSGDCTKQPWTCMRCAADDVYKIARAVAATLSTPTEDARERVKVPRIATTEMVEAGAQFTHIMDLWTAMVEAAPSTPADDCAELLREARWYVNDSLEAHEHSDGRDLLNRIDTALGNKETDCHG